MVRASHITAGMLFLRRVLRHRLACAGLIMLVVIGTVGLLAPQVAVADPFAQDLLAPLAPPSAEHPFGTDHLGRDVFSRVVWGIRVSLRVGTISLLIGAFLGILLGLAGGYFGGLTDAIVVRLVDALMSFPTILVAIFAVSIIGFGTGNVVLALGISLSPRFARVVRGQVLALAGRDFVGAARAAGASDLRIMLRHILPNCAGPIIVMATLYLPYTILVEASLSFLGLGVSPDTPTWGRIISDGRTYLQLAPWVAVAPGLAITVTSMAFNLFGDGVRDVLDPRLRVYPR